MNVCVLGGTFDPVHLGHLLVAAVARERLCPAVVMFVPAGEPWLKSGREIARSVDRMAMVRLAVAGQNGVDVSTIEIDRPGPSYTVDTIRNLKSTLPQDDELYFILGWDNLMDLPRWHEPQAIIELCRLIAVPRPGSPVPDTAVLESSLPGLSQRLVLLDKPEIDISSTAIRERVKLGLPIDQLVPESVAKYIREHRLYRGGS